MSTSVEPSVPGPSVTVLLTAYNRRQYLRAALDSALHQTLTPASFEVIVLANFDCSEFATPGRVRFVRDDSPRAGQTLARGLREARGRVVTFLDDDDLYDPGRLERVARSFGAVPGLTFYHNGYSLFTQGDPSDRPPSEVERASALPTGSTAHSGRQLTAFLRFLSARNRERNLSSSAILRDTGLRFLTYLEQIEGHTDTFLLFVGLASHGVLAFDPESLTRVRRHAANSSSAPGDLRKRRGAWTIIEEMVRESGPDIATEHYLSMRRARSLIYEHLAGEPVARSDLWRATRTVLRERAVSGWPNTLVDSALGVGGLVAFPGLAPAARLAMG